MALVRTVYGHHRISDCENPAMSASHVPSTNMLSAGWLQMATIIQGVTPGLRMGLPRRGATSSYQISWDSGANAYLRFAARAVPRKLGVGIHYSATLGRLPVQFIRLLTIGLPAVAIRQKSQPSYRGASISPAPNQSILIDHLFKKSVTLQGRLLTLSIQQ